MMKTLLVTATLAVLAAPALAQQTPTAATPAADQPPATTTQPAPAKPMTEDAFTKADADKSGSLTLAEVQKAAPKATQAEFDKYDADKSKSLSKDEFSKWAMAKATPPASAPGQ